MVNIYRVKNQEGNTVHVTSMGEHYVRLGGTYEDGFRTTDERVDVSSVLAPVRPENIYGIGMNYQGHIEEGGGARPDHPQPFLMGTNSVIGDGDEIEIPTEAPDHVDYEAELAVVIGRRARNVESGQAGDYIAGYTIANDVSARDCQEHDLQWVRAKSFDTFCPLGPCVSTEPPEGPIGGRLNGERQQSATISEMVFSPEEIVEYLSRQFTLLPRTVILTGTPSGVGFAQDPPRYLQAGDRYTVRIPGIGELSNKVVESNDNSFE